MFGLLQVRIDCMSVKLLVLIFGWVSVVDCSKQFRSSCIRLQVVLSSASLLCGVQSDLGTVALGH